MQDKAGNDVVRNTVADYVAPIDQIGFGKPSNLLPLDSVKNNGMPDDELPF